jgi:phage gp36-like protein
MAYSTNTSIYTMLPGLNTSAANTAIIDQYITRVAGKIDNYVINRYSPGGWTSASSTPPGIIQISDAIVAMWTMRSLFTRDGQNRNEWVDDLGGQALKDLNKIANGEISLADNSSGRESENTQIESTTEDYHPVFAIDEPEDWEIDPDQLDDISDDRE